MNPDPTHPNRDPTTQQASLTWPSKADTGAWWEQEEGQEYIQQHFSLKHISKYFRTSSLVSAADIDEWRDREMSAPVQERRRRTPSRSRSTPPIMADDNSACTTSACPACALRTPSSPPRQRGREECRALDALHAGNHWLVEVSVYFHLHTLGFRV